MKKNRIHVRKGRNNQLSQNITKIYTLKGKCTYLEGYIMDFSNHKQDKKYVSTVKWIYEYVEAEYKKGGDTISTL